VPIPPVACPPSRIRPTVAAITPPSGHRYRRLCPTAADPWAILSVFPAANCVPRAKAAGAHVIIVNGGETAMDRYADWLLVGQIGEILPALVGDDRMQA